MGNLILITGSRDATSAMLLKVDTLAAWADHHDHALMCGDASGVDARLRKRCYELNRLLFVYGAYGKFRGPSYLGEQVSTVDGDYLARDRVMAQRCDRGIAIMLAPQTRGTWYTGTYVESLGKRMRWAVWDEVSQRWSYYDWSGDISLTDRKVAR